MWQRHLWQRTPKATKTIILKLQAAADIKLALSSCHMLHIYCCLSHPSARGHFCYCLSDADVSLVARWISGIFLLPTLTACETCFATEAIINDHSRHQGLRLAFHYQSFRWALKSTSAFLMLRVLIAVSFPCLSVQSRHPASPNVFYSSGPVNNSVSV